MRAGKIPPGSFFTALSLRDGTPPRTNKPLKKYTFFLYQTTSSKLGSAIRRTHNLIFLCLRQASMESPASRCVQK